MLTAGLVVTAVGLVAAVLFAPPAPAPGAHSRQRTEPAAEEIVDAPHIRQAIEAAIDPDTRRGVTRLPRVTLAATGDATVVLALRNVDDDPEATYAAALDDTLRVLWAVYHSADVDRISTATVVGTFNVIGATGRARELPVLRAVLSAEHAAQLDWAALGPDEVPQLADVWWVHAGFHGREAMVDGG